MKNRYYIGGYSSTISSKEELFYIFLDVALG
jgi:hypothetical protein